MDNGLYCIEVGKCYKEYILAEGMSVRFTDSGIHILLTFKNPTCDEVNKIRSAKFDMRVGLYRKEIPYCVVKFGDDWMLDSPLLVENESDVASCELDKEYGYGVHIVLVDNRFGKVVVLRSIGLDHDLSVKIQDVISKYDKTISIKEVIRRSNEIQKKLQTHELWGILK